MGPPPVSVVLVVIVEAVGTARGFPPFFWL